VVELDLYKR